ncbi:MAG: [protein-PII] uridylyltransferase [Desulfobacterales bacterium]|nr:MAG: [protein-PII] uridylyltransferase [Desulfobacterales bacterium]
MNANHQQAAARLQRNIQRLTNRLIRAKAPDFLKQHASLLDDYFREGFATSMVGPRMGIDKNPYAFIALGGYGREEQCVRSDVDLLFLFKKTVPEAAENLIREIVYPLWDIGLDVGYATRSLKECVSLAGQDFEVLTPLLDARFICGMSHLYSELIEHLQKKVLARHSRKIISWLIESNRKRHLRFGDSTYRLEPNLKEGQGGLRDYHTMLWLARVKSQLKQPRDLEYFGLLSHDEFQNLTHALAFIWKVRNRLHILAGRKCDQLHFENQIKLAETLKFKTTNGQQAVEKFLGELQGQMEFIKQQHLMFLYELGYASRGRPRRMPTKRTKLQGLRVNRDMLDFNSLEEIMQNPNLLLDIFQESVHLKIPLSAEAKRLVREFSYLADDALINSADMVRSFERLLLAPAPTFSVLKEMLNTGFLLRFIPEFRAVANRIQYDEYHLYPVDKHLLRTVQTLKNFRAEGDENMDPLCVSLYKELKNRKLLLWAALLHDIGKGGSGEDHSRKGAEMVERILAAKGFKAEEIATVSFLVAKHLFLIKTATRRDIHDEETAIFCAREIKDVQRLKMLYLLTVADSISTGPNAWNDWTASLLRDLFFKVLKILEKGELASREAVEGIARKREIVLGAAASEQARQELAAFFAFLSPRYLLYATADQIREDIARYERLGPREFVWNITRTADPNRRTVKICARDRPGLFSKIAGIFTLNNIDIIDAQIFTWHNQIAVDIFEVNPPPDRIFEDERWARAEEHLHAALAGTLDLSVALKDKLSRQQSAQRPTATRPHRIVVDNTSSNFFTIVEVFTYDFPGLLFTITDALFRCRLDIWVAKISTKADQVVDVFYVRDFDGQKAVATDQITEIKAAIASRLPQKVPSALA